MGNELQTPSPDVAASTNWTPPKELPQEASISEGEMLKVIQHIAGKQSRLCKALNQSSIGNAGAVHLLTPRADEQGNTQVIKIPVADVVLYLEHLHELVRLIAYYKWPDDKQKPIITADLRGIIVIGDLKAQLNGITVLLHSTNFEGKFAASIQGEVSLAFEATRLQKSMTLVVNPGATTRIRATGSSVWPPSNILIRGKQTGSSSLPRISFDADTPQTFQGRVRFQNCEIFHMQLAACAFDGKVKLEQCRLSFIDLRGAIFNAGVEISRCEFFEKRRPQFVNSVFKQPTSFFYCTFQNAPAFDGALLHQDTRFFGCQFQAAGGLLKAKCNSGDAAAYRVLKSHFGKHKDSRQELAFYALEQRAERYLGKGDGVEGLLSWLHDLISSYGQSLTRVCLWFVLWNTGFALGYQQLALCFLSTKAQGPFEGLAGVALALQNAFNPLALFSEKGLVEIKSWWLYGASLLQALISIGILALVLLTIRAKFRKGSSSES
jgi:hypothetical protein